MLREIGIKIKKKLIYFRLKKTSMPKKIIES